MRFLLLLLLAVAFASGHKHDSKDCYKDGYKIKDGHSLRFDCDYIVKCKDGELKKKKQSCPAHSTCEITQGGDRCFCQCKPDYTTVFHHGLTIQCVPRFCYHKGLNAKIKNGNSIRFDCDYILKCKDGEFEKKKQRCPAHSTCEISEGGDRCFCQCKPGYKTISHYGLTRKCVPQNCYHKGLNLKIKNGHSIRLNCKHVLKCKNGKFEKRLSKCPHYSKCVAKGHKFRCHCQYGYKAIYHHGITKKCVTKTCIYKKKVLKNLHRRRHNCKQIVKCEWGKLKKRDRKCPPYSKCKHNRCVCYYGYKPVKKYGIIVKCVTKTCRYRNKVLKNLHRRRHNCKKIVKCEWGKLKKRDRKCPPYSKCKHNRCVCYYGYKPVKKYGIIVKCVTKTCRYRKKVLKNLHRRRHSCQKIVKCEWGKLRKRDRKCPPYSKCKRNRCVCYYGYRPVRKYGIIVKCGKWKQEEAPSKMRFIINAIFS